MAERLLLIVGLAALLIGVRALLRLRQARRLRLLAAERPLQGLVPTGRPAVVAFTLPSCVECRARQKPALEQLRAQRAAAVAPGRRADEYLIATLSAEAHPEVVGRLGILTVPATAVLDAQGQVRFINQGFADAARLAAQLDSLAA
jgi:hypothetical protein